jgi:hypothetical protein
MRRHKYWWLVTTIYHVVCGYDAVTFGEYLQNFGEVFFLLQDSCPSWTSTHGVISEKLNLHVTVGVISRLRWNATFYLILV